MKNKILVVDDDALYRGILTKVFSEYELSVSSSGKEAIKVASEISPDLIILDIEMEGMDGYEVCTAFRGLKGKSTTPIIFYSGNDSLEYRLKAYDYGGNDYICKMRPHEEIKAKAEAVLHSENEHRAIQIEIGAQKTALLNIQKETSQLFIVSQFTQACQFCGNQETLATVLLNCLRKLDVRAVVLFRDNQDIFSTSGVVSKLETEILTNSQEFGRIHSFGKGRAILNWSSAALIVKDVGDILDTLAHLLGAIDNANRAISIQTSLIEKVIGIEAENRELRRKIKDEVDRTQKSLKEQLFDSGLISRFDVQDEVELESILEPYGNDLDTFLSSMDNNASEIIKLVEKSKTYPEELRSFFDGVASEEDVLF